MVDNPGGNIGGTALGGMNNVTTSPFTFANNDTMGTLANNGGPTPTLAIPTSGPAYQAGDLATCQSLQVVGPTGTIYTGATAVDQRGAARVVGGKCSIGAFEPGLVPSATTLSASASSISFGQSVTFTAVVSGPLGGGPSDGTVTFTNNGSTLGTGTPSGGTATAATNTLQPGNSVTATYGGGTNYAASGVSNTVSVTVTAGACVVNSTLDPTDAGKITLRDAVNGGKQRGLHEQHDHLSQYRVQYGANDHP